MRTRNPQMMMPVGVQLGETLRWLDHPFHASNVLSKSCRWIRKVVEIADDRNSKSPPQSTPHRVAWVGLESGGSGLRLAPVMAIDQAPLANSLLKRYRYQWRPEHGASPPRRDVHRRDTLRNRLFECRSVVIRRRIASVIHYIKPSHQFPSIHLSYTPVAFLLLVILGVK